MSWAPSPVLTRALASLPRSPAVRTFLLQCTCRLRTSLRTCTIVLAPYMPPPQHICMIGVALPYGGTSQHASQLTNVFAYSQLNSPSKITGTYKLLVERFGQDGATDIITKNPGILSCVAESVAKQDDADILKAADFVEKVEEKDTAGVKATTFGHRSRLRDAGDKEACASA